MNYIFAGMNKYRKWIGGGEFRPLLASWLLSALIMFTLMAAAYSPWYGWSWVTTIAVAAIPLEVYLGVAQMTSWRWNGLEAAADVR